MLKTLKNSITQMQKELEKKIPYLNHGGCIWFAYYFEKALKKLNVSYKIYAYHHEPLGTTYRSFDGAGHILVYIDNIGLIDGHEIWSNIPIIYKYTKQYRYKNKLRLKNLYKLATGKGWNYTYNKDKYNSELETIINTYIK